MRQRNLSSISGPAGYLNCNDLIENMEEEGEGEEKKGSEYERAEKEKNRIFFKSVSCYSRQRESRYGMLAMYNLYYSYNTDCLLQLLWWIRILTISDRFSVDDRCLIYPTIPYYAGQLVSSFCIYRHRYGTLRL